ncbi:MAG: ribonuclease Z [Bacteroidales bacterium]|nr:ribonuclease Z [Bacteroidales bacterium]
MKEFELTILGCSSAKPTRKHHPSSQVLSYRGKLFMIDCGEGTQQQFYRYGLNHNRLGHIFISHLHGDHCFGLIGFISTLELHYRTGEIVIHAPSDLECLLRPQIEYYCGGETLKIRIEPLPPKGGEIYNDGTLKVTSFPLKHRVPTFGFRFEEINKLPHIIKERVERYNIPLRLLPSIKDGADYITPEGEVIPNGELVSPPTPSVSYAYCSDTKYTPSIIPYIKGATLLYHEATYLHELEKTAKKRYHSTALQAAQIAKEAEVGELLIGHFSSRYKEETVLLNEAKQEFVNSRLANEGLKIKF